jgi:Leucine-rich repeat (LRR) protein
MECQSNQLTNLYISNNTKLAVLACSSNQLTGLDVSKNTLLTYLNCSYNQLTSLDVSNNTLLTKLLCSFNQLTSLDISNNNSIKELYISAMPSLYKVCVWEMPFPPTDAHYVHVDMTDSPNVYFTTDCTGGK